jgi:phosphoribosylformylglycinamidine synthase II
MSFSMLKLIFLLIYYQFMPFNDKTFDFANMSETQIRATLKENNIILSVSEALDIQQRMLKRPPTLTECLLWSIQSSEHCSYKSTRKHLKNLPTTGPEVILGPKEDAGIVSIGVDNAGHRYGIVISHESHNHPSQIVPFEGAATGVGGNVRDVSCMGADVIGVADSLRFGDITSNKTKWIHENVVAGIASYGNAIGVPNIGGDLYYDADYNDNCLVTVVTIGLVREDHIIHSYAPKNAVGYDLILVGKATDNSGFAGASFASIELAEEEKSQNRGAVQEPNAFLGRHLLKANSTLFKILCEQNLLAKVGFKDLGAGGVACASVELAESGGYGARVNVDAIPVSMEGLHPAVILCSETQERYMWVAAPEITPLILKHYNETFALPEISDRAQAKVVGKIIAEHDYLVTYQNTEIIHAKAADITAGFCYDRPWQTKELHLAEPVLLTPKNFNQVLLDLLGHENIASRKPVFETYDKQVQGRTLVESGTADAGVLQPFNSSAYPQELSQIGVALGCAQNPRYGKIDAYWSAVNAVVEAVRNIAAVGARPLAITDCLCFGNPEKPEQMAEFVNAVKGITAACSILQIPVISGNVSLYNESKTSAIPPSPIISCLGKIENITKVITLDFKQPESILVLLGARKNECGGSVYYALHHQLGANVPQPDCQEVLNEITALHLAAEQQLVLAAHDISDGGIAVALAEMSFKNNLGCEINIIGELTDEIKLFSETGGFILEIAANKFEQLTKILHSHQVNYAVIGKTTIEAKLNLQKRININISTAKSAWENGLRNKLTNL